MPLLTPTRNNDALFILRALTILNHRKERHIYEGTVAPETIAKRRAANRVARASRRQNRSR